MGSIPQDEGLRCREKLSLYQMDLAAVVDPAGPVDPSVLTDHAEHRSTHIARGEVVLPVHPIEHCRDSRLWTMTSQPVLILVRRAGFYEFSRLGYLKLDKALINALIERWRRETQTFHMRHGEMTVTLRDVAILAGLRVDGPPVTGRTSYDWRALCIDLLGAAPQQLNTGCVRLRWLRDTFHVIPEGAEQVVLDRCARAYILWLIGNSLLPDPSGNKVHLRYLALLRDFDECGKLAWGAATLAHLYRELGKACMVGKVDCCAFLRLLQIWSWEHLHVGRPARGHVRLGRVLPLDGPLGCRWVDVILTHVSNPRSAAIQFYRNELDHQVDSQVTWQPYPDATLAGLPAICTEGRDVWLSKTPLICFHIVEMHVPDRVLRQFGLNQHVPVPVVRLDRVDGRGRSTEDWEAYHAVHIATWQERHTTVVHEQEGVDQDPARAREIYMQWYWSITRRWITSLQQPQLEPQSEPQPEYRPRGPYERCMMDTLQTARAKLLRLHERSVYQIPREFRDEMVHIVELVDQTLASIAPAPPATVPIFAHAEVAKRYDKVYRRRPTKVRAEASTSQIDILPTSVVTQEPPPRDTTNALTQVMEIGRTVEETQFDSTEVEIEKVPEDADRGRDPENVLDCGGSEAEIATA